MQNLTFIKIWSHLNFLLKELYDILSQSAVLPFLAGFFVLRWIVRSRKKTLS
jgi:hypothetical protein